MTQPDYRHAVYAGSFDPPTLGHTAVMERAARLYDRVTVAVGDNTRKQCLFSVRERETLLQEAVHHLPHVEVRSFEGLLVDFCRRSGAGVIVRGLRLLTDFEYEFQLGLANRDLAPDIETVFVLTESSHVYMSSSLVKEIARNGGAFGRYVPEAVERALAQRFGKEAQG
jgi:pantetheine-phosphate adenylyltransferase